MSLYTSRRKVRADVGVEVELRHLDQYHESFGAILCISIYLLSVRIFAVHTFFTFIMSVCLSTSRTVCTCIWPSIIACARIQMLTFRVIEIL